MEFLVIAMDGEDAGGLDRRMASREAHLTGIATLREQGHLVAGGAILDDDGKMIGSAVIYEFADRESVEKCIAEDPYTKGGVWRNVTIHPYRMVR